MSHNMGSSSEPKWYDYIVIGIGGIGSGALYWLSRRNGASVLGLEQFKLGHENGGSQDHSRIIRMAYPDERYTKLTPHTFKAWAEVEEESGVPLVYKTGALDLTRRGTLRAYLIDDQIEAMTRQNIPFEKLTASQVRERFPQWKVKDDVVAVYQKDGGLVDAANGNSVHVQLAQSRGVTVIDHCPVLRLEPVDENRVLVHTPRGTFACRRVIVTSGAWTNHVLGSVGVTIPIVVTQEQVTYMATPHVKKFTKSNFPVFRFVADRLNFYGFPMHGNSGSKLGIDSGGHQTTATTRTFTPDPVREKACVDFFKEYVPEAAGPVMYTKTCLYASTYDKHFIVDDLSIKGMPQIVVCVGAGHAYKFASLLGKMLTELAVDGKSSYPIDGFTMNRDAVMNPNAKPTFNFDYSAGFSKL